ncbi:TGS domain-containing protein [candidate division WWE3 bacterium]|nr:TGS domain-containing protein [candidate division WWE3 bacterium]
MSLPQAKKLAEKIYKNKTRLSGETYYEHALEIANRLKKYGIQEEITLITAILHHALDEKKTTAQSEIAEISKEAADLLEKYKRLTKTDIKTESLTTYNERYIMQTFVNLVEDIRVLIIRAVDKLHALENSWALEKEKREEAAQRALYLYAPLAKILGVSKISKDLEDTAFKILYPDKYFKIKKSVQKRSWGTKKIFREVEKFLKEILAEQGIENFKIQYRVKSAYSLHRKVERYKKEGKALGEDLSKIYDLFALRLVLNTVEECYLTENLLAQLWEEIPNERDDYIKNPRSTGYQSIHNAFQIDNDFIAEVQIRTHEMHQQAEFGISSHLLYKIGDKGAKSKAVDKFKKYLQKHPEWFKDLNFWEIAPDKKYIPKTPFSDNIYTFTPKGDIIELPKGASVVDFAYKVHTEVGNNCAGAFVNGKIVKLDHVLRTGDTVKIKVDKRKRRPSKDWLEFVETRAAKIHINRAWRE